MLAALRSGNLDEARQALRNGLRPIQQAGDSRKLVSALDALAGIESRSGNVAVARKHLSDAVEIAKKANLREERKALKRKLDSLPA